MLFYRYHAIILYTTGANDFLFVLSINSFSNEKD